MVSKTDTFWHMLPVIFDLGKPGMLEQRVQTAMQYINTVWNYCHSCSQHPSTINWLVNETLSAFGVGFLHKSPALFLPNSLYGKCDPFQD